MLNIGILGLFSLQLYYRWNFLKLVQLVSLISGLSHVEVRVQSTHILLLMELLRHFYIVFRPVEIIRHGSLLPLIWVCIIIVFIVLFYRLVRIIFLGRINKKFQILIDGIRSLSNNGWVAIDDISFDSCQLPATNRSCTNSEFRCDRGSCVSQDKLCDIVDDCGDNSDENRPSCSSYIK